ncbi:hypothetical protein AC629_08680 [Bradyrhizobium sp. NAS80.1]|uniref:hypothetical protein n=1 Tax=Bradyrhizobium sp. NAS80.1 TaxID=1680159 RepID=UPI00096175F4|nr:hypothetical protein [Bradyrhizobium sp. NAS80.1]OKO88677.1 hypothetical protein AC629_08680 [Bradyrhizobium sp. NAS80.1]
MRGDRRLLIVLLAVFAAAVGLLLDVHPLWRLILAAPLVLVLPGAALLRLFPGRMAAPGRYALMAGLSMAVCVLGGLLLNAVGALTTLGWFVLLSAISLAGALVAPHPRAAIPRPWSGLALRPRHGVLVAATLAAMTVTLSASLRNATAFYPFAYTQFWMLPVRPGSTGYEVGIRNQERRPEVVTLRVTVDGTLVGVWRDIAVAPGETVLKRVGLPEGRKAEAMLFRAGPDNTVELLRKVSASLPPISTVSEMD